jgi:hypothetical protein
VDEDAPPLIEEPQLMTAGGQGEVDLESDNDEELLRDLALSEDEPEWDEEGVQRFDPDDLMDEDERSEPM